MWINNLDCSRLCVNVRIDEYFQSLLPWRQGVCGEKCAAKYSISREAQDEFAIESYKRSQAAGKAGVFQKEIVPVTVPQKKG